MNAADGNKKEFARKPKIGFCSLGCAKNQVDSEVMLGTLQSRGFAICSDPGEAEIIVVNTCAFIDEAKEESINAILEMVEYKKEGSCLRLIVAGCLSQRYREELLKSVPEIDACLSLDEMDKLADVCSGSYLPRTTNPALPQRSFDKATHRVRTTPRHYAYLKVSDGCDHRCTFCVIPNIRGQYRSRPIEALVEEAQGLIKGGVVELNLVAQDLGPYGKDIGIVDGLVRLLEKLVGLDGLRWLRLLYVYPEGLNKPLIDLMASQPKIVPYLDIPLQHASLPVLKSMGRAGDGESYLKKIEELRTAVPGLAIRTSLLVGYPTEQEKDFKVLLEFVRAARFDHLGVFTYSHEEGSEAFENHKDRWPPEVKAERRDRVMAIQQKIALENNQAKVNRTLACLVEGYHPESELLLAGRLATQAPEVDGCVIINEGSANAGEIVKVEITEAHPYDLVGRVVSAK